MEKRMIQKLGVELTRLGFGAMRMPEQDGHVIRPAAEEMIDCMKNAGVNYFDTAYFYENSESEEILGAALAKYPRDSYYLADKLPIREYEDPDEIRRITDEQFRRLGLDRIDFHLLHGIGLKSWQTAKKLGAPEFQRELREQGKVRFVGFSFHGAPEELEEILDDGYEWDFVQIQLNYYDWDGAYRAREQYEILEKRGIPVIVMEGCRGGMLCNLPGYAAKIIEEEFPERTAANLAYRWVGSLPGVAVVLTGASTLEQTEENAAIFTDFEPITEREREGLRRVVDAITAKPTIPCTKCRYCIDCPQGVNIPHIFFIYNEQIKFDCDPHTRWRYTKELREDERADQCIGCGYCESVCPQRISIIDELQKCRGLIEEVLARTVDKI